MANALLIIDMLRGFMEPGHALYCGDDARAIIPNVRALAEQELRAGGHIVFLCDNHAPDDLEFQMFPPHCVAGSDETEIIPELRDLPGEVMPKSRYSSFYNTPLAERLAVLDPDRLILAGVCTNICVLYTAADARNRDYRVEVPRHCVASFDSNAHAGALKQMEEILGVQLVDTASHAPATTR